MEKISGVGKEDLGAKKRSFVTKGSYSGGGGRSLRDTIRPGGGKRLFLEEFLGEASTKEGV